MFHNHFQIIILFHFIAESKICEEVTELELDCTIWSSNSTKNECKMPCSKDYCVQKIIEGRIYNLDNCSKSNSIFPMLGWSDCISWVCHNMPNPHPHPNGSVKWPICLGIAIFLALLIAILMLLWKMNCENFCVEIYLSLKTFRLL